MSIKVSNSSMCKNIELIQINENNVASIKLRKNFEEKQETEEICGLTTTMHIYDEVELHLTYFKDLLSNIEKDFDKYWDFAEAQEKNNKDLEQKTKEFNKMMENMDIVDNFKAMTQQITDLILNSELK